MDLGYSFVTIETSMQVMAMQATLAGYPRHRENRENGQKKSLSGKTQEIWKFCQNTGNFVCSSCKFPDSQGKGYCEFPFFFLKPNESAEAFCVCYSYRLCKLAQEKFSVGQGKHREFQNTI